MSIARKLRRGQTDAERALWSKLRSKQLNGAKFRRQQSVGCYIVDFINFENKLILELDGSQHNRAEERNRDDDRTRWLEGRGYQVVRFWDNEVLQNMDGVLEKILAALK